MPKHTVTKGECIHSIAFQYGFFWEVVWNDEGNAALRELRKSQNTLVVDDVVNVPEKRIRQEACQTAAVHTFELKGVPALCRIQAFEGDEPRALQQYTLTIDGVKHSGTTDEEGYLQAPMPPKSKKAILVVGPANDTYEFVFGELEPVETVAGQQARLSNLGYECGEVTGAWNEETAEAVKQFQRRAGLKVTGEADAETQQKLKQLHDDISDMPTGEDEQVEEEADEIVKIELED